MSPPSLPPDPVRRILRRLLPGTRGAEILEELDREYATLRERRSVVLARVWYLAQILRPATWRLGWALRQTRHAERGAGVEREVRTKTDADEARDDDTRGSRRFGGLSLDLKLAGRMLMKSPGLTLVGVLGIALGVAVGVGAFVIIASGVDPELPLDEGERIVALQNWDVDANEEVLSSVHDFVTWRQQVRSVERIAAASMRTHLLVTGDAPPQDVRTAAMTAVAFDVARVPPLLGRTLAAEDERPGAPRVAVLGYDLWRTRFGGDPGVIGRTILVGDGTNTVVGVMPPGFAFPMNEELWTALQASPTQYERGHGPGLIVFGRLVPEATREQAQAELTALGRRMAADSPETHAHLRPQVLPYALAVDGPSDVTLWEMAQVQLMVTLILMAIAANMAVLVYARTALRQGEIAVRTALGASRRRIVAQLFMEALLLSTLGAGLGLFSAHLVLHQFKMLFDGLNQGGFWVDWGLQPRTAAYALGLALITAVIVGVVPGLKATGRTLDTHLRRLGAGVSPRLGWMWTAMIVVQVAVAVTLLPTVLDLGIREITMVATRATYPADEFLSAEVAPAVSLRPGMDAEAYRRESTARFAERLPELERRLEAEPAVTGVTLEGRLRGRGSLVEVEGIPGPAEGGAHRIGSAGVAPDYFDLLGLRMLAGRPLRDSDVEASGGGLVVSEAFVRWILDGGPAIGRRVRFVSPHGPGEGAVDAEPAPWLEIVGVVQNPVASVLDAEWAPPRAFYPVGPGTLQAATVLVRVRGGDVDGFTSRFRGIVAGLDPELRVGSVGSLSTMVYAPIFATMVSALVVVLGSVLLLSAAGIHALTSLAVTRRRREIGVRRALGSGTGRLLANVFSRVAWQLGLGGVVGSLLGGVLLLGSGRTGREVAIFLGGVVVLMLAAGLVAAVGPALRGLRVQPAEALREE